MVAALPHCDALVSGHSFAALGEVADAIAGADVRAAAFAAPAAEEPEPWASATPVPGQLGRDAQRLRPEPRRTRRRDGRSVAEKTCIYPGCERPAVPPHPLGGPQPAFCDLEEHNALTAHQERQRLEREKEDRSG